MMKIPAFPVSTGCGEKIDNSAGMDLRDYFAAQIVNGMILARAK